MIHNKDIINCLPLLASVLGDRYGVEVRIGGDSACTDGRIIRIPALPIDCDKTALALAKGYIDHESAHIRHTVFTIIREAGLDAPTRYLFNSIEDWRVEQRISAIYPGCRQNLDWLIRRFFVEEEAGAGEKSPALAVLSYVLLTVRSWDVSEVNGHRTRTRAQVAQAYPGLAEKLDAVLDRVCHDCPDTAAALKAARELVEIIRAFQPEEPEKEQQGGGGEKQNGKEQGGQEAPTASSSKSEEPEKEGSKEQRASASSSDSETDGNKSASESGQIDRSDSDGEAQQAADTGTGEGGDEAGDGVNGAVDLGAFLDALDEESLPKNLGERIAGELSGAGASAPASAEGCVEVATPGFRVVTELAPEEIAKALRCSVALRKRLQGLLQAHELRHVALGRRGKLDDHKLYRLSTANPRVFRREDNQPGQNSAVHVLLDCSGSMCGEPIQLARQCCYAVAKALEPIKGVNAAVTAFPAIADGELGVKPLVRHGERVSNQFGVEGIGGTPLAPALWWVTQNLYAQKEARKIVFIITDGRPDSVPACRTAISRMRALGMEVYGIGIRLPLIGTLLPRTSKVIFDLTELAPAIFGLLQAALLKGVSR